MSTSTIRATKESREALARYQLLETAGVLRMKVEDAPALYGHLRDTLDRAERDINDGRLPMARDRLGEVAAGLVAKDQAIEDQRRTLEQTTLAEARGADTKQLESGARTRDGWLWLLSKEKYEVDRREAGRLFREKWSRAVDSLPSCIAGSVGGGGDAPSTSAAHAKFELDSLRFHMRRSVGARSAARLYWLLEEVVGKGETVRKLSGGKDRDGEVMVAELGIALDLAGVFLGAVRI